MPMPMPMIMIMIVGLPTCCCQVEAIAGRVRFFGFGFGSMASVSKAASALTCLPFSGIFVFVSPHTFLCFFLLIIRRQVKVFPLERFVVGYL